jgi:hypothetical protein
LRCCAPVRAVVGAEKDRHGTVEQHTHSLPERLPGCRCLFGVVARARMHVRNVQVLHCFSSDDFDAAFRRNNGGGNNDGSLLVNMEILEASAKPLTSDGDSRIVDSKEMDDALVAHPMLFRIQQDGQVGRIGRE